MKDLYEDTFQSVEDIQQQFELHNYICSRQIATCTYIAYNLQKPVMVEGPAGVGKTELAKTTAEILGVPLVRLQCYEGLDESKALYEWKYGKQLLYTQLLKDKLSEVLDGATGLRESMAKLESHDDLFFSEGFLEPRPLYQALREEHGCVLLIDEIDKSDHEFEAFLLEILSEFQVSIPELGTLGAKIKPLVFLTSNNTREMSDALKRRCLHLHIDFPDEKLERRIINKRVPKLSETLRGEVVSFVQQVRELDIKKAPSISETIDWAKTLLLLHTEHLENQVVKETLNVILKFEEDIDAVNEQLTQFIKKAQLKKR
ncbi:MAG: MoxR family ATPase [Gammaproteobacteria bacterium]|nr:MAG: MoxR family ATPase [Gammaproteobacteria bacterium]RLA22192.1 MAG: MoxR family ATPase [Gammaproteobacteria bacterium]